MPPDDVLEDLADVLGLVERRDDGADRLRPDLVAALDELDELVHDRARGGDPLVVALDRELVPAQAQRAVEPLAQRVEHAVADAGQLGGDLVRDGERFLHAAQSRSRICRDGETTRARRAQGDQGSRAKLAETYPWIDADELEHDEAFDRLVELLTDRESVSDEAFEERCGSAPSSCGPARSQRSPPAVSPRTPGSEEQRSSSRTVSGASASLLLRALGRVDEDVIMKVLRCAEADWSDTPLARAVARFLDARVAAGERLAADELEELEPGLQPLLVELLAAAAEPTRAALEPAVDGWRRSTLDTSILPRARADRRPGRATRPPRSSAPARSRSTRVVAALSAEPALGPSCSSASPASGKTTLVVEALRRLGTGRLAFQATAAWTSIAGQVYIGMLEGRMQEIVGRLAHRPVVWIFPSFEEALWSGQHQQSPRACSTLCFPHVESGEAAVVGEIDPLADELLVRHRPRVTRLFEVVRLTPIVDADALAVARDWAEHNELEVDDETLAEALDLASHYLPPPPRRLGASFRLPPRARARRHRARPRSSGDARDGALDPQRP